MSYKIGSFNCFHMSRTSNKDVSVIADMILTQGFDIVALQEVHGKKALRQITDRLPSNWKWTSDEESTDKNTSRDFDYAFLWNARRVDLVKSKLNNGQTRTYKPRIYKQYKIDRQSSQRRLNHEPFFARFTPSLCGGPFFEIRIINTHIRFSKYSADTDGDNLGAIQIRRNEFDILAKSIYAKEADKRYGNNMPAYTVLLGDYNLNHRESKLHGASGAFLDEMIEVEDNGTVKQLTTVQSELSTLKQKPPESSDFNQSLYANNYDHFTYDQVRFSESTTVTTKKIDTLKTYFDGDIEKHRKELSDHVPVMLELSLS